MVDDYYNLFMIERIIKSVIFHQNNLSLFIPSPICLNSSAQDILNTLYVFLDCAIIDLQVLFICNLYKSPITTHTYLALDKATFNLRPSPTNPIVFFALFFLSLPYFEALTELKMITCFYRPWKESMVFTSAFIFDFWR